MRDLGIHDASRHLNREIDSQLDQIIFDLGIHNVGKSVNRVLFDHDGGSRLLCASL